jgi:hypothetical protein
MSRALVERVNAQAQEIASLKLTIAQIRDIRNNVLQSVPEHGVPEPIDTTPYEQKFEEIRRALRAIKAKHLSFLQHFHEELERFRAEVLAEISSIAALAREQVRSDPSSTQSSQLCYLTFPLDPRAPLNGVIGGLRRFAGRNVHDEGIVEVTASSCHDESRFPPTILAYFPADAAFVSKDEPMSWIGYHFNGGAKLRFRNYAVRSRFDGWANSNNLKDWVIEVSDDGENWTTVDTRVDNSDLNATNATKVFELATDAEGEYIRIRQTGPSHSGKDFLVLSGFELFGTFIA